MAPGYLCEVDDEGHIPTVLSRTNVASSIRRVHAAYEGKLRFGLLDAFGTGLDVLTANALTELLGTVVMPAPEEKLRAVYREASGLDPGRPPRPRGRVRRGSSEVPREA